MGRKSLKETGVVTKEILEELYLRQSLSVLAIASQLNIGAGSVYNYLRVFEIPRRNKGSRKSKDTSALYPGDING